MKLPVPYKCFRIKGPGAWWIVDADIAEPIKELIKLDANDCFSCLGKGISTYDNSKCVKCYGTGEFIVSIDVDTCPCGGSDIKCKLCSGYGPSKTYQASFVKVLPITTKPLSKTLTTDHIVNDHGLFFIKQWLPESNSYYVQHILIAPYAASWGQYGIKLKIYGFQQSQNNLINKDEIIW
jgi:hypothetical protein